MFAAAVFSFLLISRLRREDVGVRPPEVLADYVFVESYDNRTLRCVCVCVCACMCVCLCVCLCVCTARKERKGKEENRDSDEMR